MANKYSESDVPTCKALDKKDILLRAGDKKNTKAFMVQDEQIFTSLDFGPSKKGSGGYYLPRTCLGGRPSRVVFAYFFADVKESTKKKKD